MLQLPAQQRRRVDRAGLGDAALAHPFERGTAFPGVRVAGLFHGAPRLHVGDGPRFTCLTTGHGAIARTASAIRACSCSSLYHVPGG